MSEAVKVCLDCYLDVVTHDDPNIFNKDKEVEYYSNHILQSCSPIGELKN